VKYCLKTIYANSSGRSKEAVKGVVLSVVAKMIYVLSSFLTVPLMIDYVNATRYGIWLTLSSIIGWVTLFDLGLGNGFRNRFAEAKAEGNIELARCYLSTTYFSVSFIVIIIYIFICLCSVFIDWSMVINVEPAYNEELGEIFIILSAFFCMTMVANLVSTMLMADQKTGFASMIQGGGQLLSLISVWILTRISEGSLTNLALYYAGMPCLLTIVVTLFVYSSDKYKNIAPHFRYIKMGLIRDILGIGVQFFIIYLCMIFIFQIINIIISREIGPEAVTEYNIAYKYFALLNTINIIVLTPFWSAFTDAYKRNDYSWMKRTIKALEFIWVGNSATGLLMCILAPYVYLLWVGANVEVSQELSLCVCVYVIILNLGNLYMYLINGIGTVRIQLIIYLSFAFVSWPLMTVACRLWGVAGVVVIPTIVMLFQAVFGKIQLRKLLDKTAKGIWLR
jgi:O-antigen/teichoic acid export membrane protein